jgi:MreB/Mrl family cell shape determining protein
MAARRSVPDSRLANLGQHDCRSRWRHHRGRGDFTSRNDFLPLGVRGRGQNGRGDHPAHQAQYNLLIGERTAELNKITIGSAYLGNKIETMEIKGRDLVAGVPKTIEITDEEIREALMAPVHQVVEAVRIALERTPPELATDIVEKGIVLAGGGALLRNLDVLLREETGLPVTLAGDPLTAVVMGAGKVLDESSQLRDVTVD